MEKFFGQYEHTLDAISAVATFAAVVVSLWVTALNAKAHRTRLKVSASIRMIVIREIDKAEWPQYLVIYLTNVGLMRAKVDVNFFHWHIPFTRGAMMITPYDTQGDMYLPARQYPFFIEPNESATVYIATLANFQNVFDQRYIGNRFKRFLAKFMYPTAFTVDGRIFKVKMDSEVKKVIREHTRLLPKRKR